MTKTHSQKTSRFEQKRERILDAATQLINQHGIKGMTFVEVANLVELNTTSITYYFKRKEQLAAAVLERSLARIEAMIVQAGKAATPRERVKQLITINFDLFANIRRTNTPALAGLTDLRALEQPYKDALFKRYHSLFDKVRHYFPATTNAQQNFFNTASAHVLLDTMLWLPAWLATYSIGDFDRACAQLVNIFEHGLASHQSLPAPTALEHGESQLLAQQDGIPEQFLRAATNLINEVGYRGASVEKISSELNVTKGSFYHHLPTKDALVHECFRHSYHRITLIQRAADGIESNHGQKLLSSLKTLLNIQLCSKFPLLRSTAWQALPAELRSDIRLRYNRSTQRFASRITDGIFDGSLRQADPAIASQVIMTMLNAAFELRNAATQLSDDDITTLYANTIMHGLFNS